MNIHELTDHLAINLGAVVMARSKYFRDGIDTAPFSQPLAAVELEVPDIAGEGHHELVARTLAGELSAACWVAQWWGPDWPTIVYHHGAGDIPFGGSFQRLFPYRKLTIPANLIAVRAPWHRSLKDFRHGISTLEKVVAMLAVSTCLVEKLLGRVQELGATPTLVTGISLGGFVANRHHARYNSADCYVPVLAGAAMGEVFVNSIYRRGVARRARENSQAIKAVLDFEEEYAAVAHHNVYPVLARHDQIVLYHRQKSCYGEQPILTLEKGHITGAVAYEKLRRHILSTLPVKGQRCWG
jgi:hypothetical protein